MLKIPYDEIELKVALLSLLKDEKKFTGKSGQKIFLELENEFKDKIPSEKKDLNKRIAEHNGITVEQFISSPNYKVLCGEYMSSIYKQIAKRFVEKFKITKKQAWAIVAEGIGLLD